MNDQHPEVVRHAIRLSHHESPRVRRQVAWSLGEATSVDVAEILVTLASRREPDAYVSSAVLSSINSGNAERCLGLYLKLPASDRSPAILRSLAKSTLRLCESSQDDDVLMTLLPLVILEHNCYSCSWGLGSAQKLRSVS